MKNHIFGASALAALLAASPAFAADSEPVTSRALLLKPFVLTKLDDLNFGRIIPTGSNEWVHIDADTGVRTFSTPGMRDLTDDGFRARFASSGVDNERVVLELDGPANLVNTDGDLLRVAYLELDQNNKVVRTLTATSQVFFVGIGGEVSLRGNQEEGVYTGTFTLTATYL